MEKIVKKQTSIFKKLLVLLGVVAGLLVFGLIVLLAIQPILDGIDHSKFTSLEYQSKSIFNDIQKASAGVDDWKYEKKCIDLNANYFGPSDYFCNTTTELVASVSSAKQIKDLHNKYFPIIDASKYLKSSGSLSAVSPYQFGVDFVISSADKQYSSEDGYKCTYSAKLAQPNEQGIAYGTPITGGIGQALLVFDCTGKARSDWYKN